MDKIDYICANIELKCSVLTDKNEKIHHDEAHQTLAGSKYFGRIVAEQDWLKID